MFNYKLNYFILLTFIGSLLGCHDKAGPIEQVNQHHQSPDVVDKKNEAPGKNSTTFPNRAEYTNLGFSNLGNTCFANAVFKLLSANPEFLEFLNSTNNAPAPVTVSEKASGKKKKKKKRNKKKGKNKKRKNRNYRERQQDTSAREDQSESDDQTEKAIKENLNNLLSRFKFFERSEIDRPQSENKTRFYEKELTSFFNDFNSYLKKEYGEEGGLPYFKYKENGFIPGSQQDPTEFLEEILTTVLEFNKQQPFYLSTRPESADGIRKNSATSHIFFPVNLQISDSKVNSLSEAFDKFVEEETLSPENGVEPEQGGEKLTQLKRKIAVLNFDQIPSYFFATMTRFNNNLEKDGKYIDSKTPIRLHIYQQGSEWEDNAKSIAIDYEPIGFVVHSGDSPHRGHYYSYIYDDHSKSWFEHNDSTVTKIDHPTDVEKAWNDIGENGYIVLYREKQRAPAY